MKKNEKNQEQAIMELKVTRELLDAKTKSGDDMYGYVLKEKIVVNGQEREIRVDFAAKDIGGYDMLDIIFMISDFAYLVMHDETMKDEDGKATQYRVYEIANEDELGVKYVYKVKPARESDKALLNVLIQQRQIFIENIDVAAESN